MPPETPHANHSGLGPLASRYVDVDSLPWEKTPFPGVEMKVLMRDSETGMVTTLTRMAPGASLPDHTHVGIEQSYVLEGTLQDEDGAATAGQFVWRPAGSRHTATSPDGCLVIAFLQRPNTFHNA